MLIIKNMKNVLVSFLFTYTFKYGWHGKHATSTTESQMKCMGTTIIIFIIMCSGELSQSIGEIWKWLWYLITYGCFHIREKW